MRKNSLKLNNKLKNDILTFINEIKNPKSRKRAYVVSLGISALEKFLNDKHIETDTYNCCSNNPILLGEFDVADIKANNLKIDVRVTVTDEYSQMWIPRNHLIYGFSPDLYVGIKLNSKLNKAEVVGFIESKKINHSSGNKNYIIVESSDLKPTFELIDIINSLNSRLKPFLSKDHDRTKELFLSYLDNEISNVDKEYLVRHIANCDECRNDFNILYNLNRIFIQTSNNKELTEMFSEIRIKQEHSTHADDLLDTLIAGTTITSAVAATDAAAKSINNIMLDKLTDEISQDGNLFGKIKNIFFKNDKVDVNSINISEKANDISDLTIEINNFDDAKQSELIDKIKDVIDNDFEEKLNQDFIENYNIVEDTAPIFEDIQQEELTDEIAEDIQEKTAPISEEIQQDELIDEISQNVGLFGKIKNVFFKKDNDEVTEDIQEETIPISEDVQQDELTNEVTEDIQEETTPISEEIQQDELIDEAIQEETTPIFEEIQQEELTDEITKDIKEEYAPIIDEVTKDIHEEITPVSEEIQQEELTDEITKDIKEEYAPIIDEVTKDIHEEITPVSEEIQQEEITDEIFEDTTLIPEDIQQNELTAEISQDVSFFGKIKNIFFKNDISDLTREIHDFDIVKQSEIIEEIHEEFTPVSEDIQQEEIIDEITEEVIEEVQEELAPISENIQQEELIDEITEDIHEETAPIPENIQQEELIDEITEDIHEETAPIPENIQQEEITDEVIEEIHEEFTPVSENIQQEEITDEVIEEIHEEFTPVSEDIQQEELIDEVIEEIHEEFTPVSEDIQQEEIIDEVIEEVHEEFTPVSEDIQQEELIDEVIEEIHEEFTPVSEDIQQEEIID
ncbi:MAG: DUF1822 family protein, partial [Candidatus Gastranaerophilales bacterium]|nr:DUF1822 family protein [Candidatus Gastranaerophilales bacterium]